MVLMHFWPESFYIFRMDPFSTNQGFSMLNIFKKSKSQASVENTIAVIGVKMALLVGELSRILPH